MMDTKSTDLEVLSNVLESLEIESQQFFEDINFSWSYRGK